MERALCRTIVLAMSLLLCQFSARSQGTAKTAHSEAVSSPPYPNSADGLARLLQRVMATAKSGDQVRVTADIREMEIPNYETWFVNTFGEEKGESWAQPYGKELRENQRKLQALISQFAQRDGKVSATKVGIDAKPGSLEWGLSQALKRPADYYVAESRTSSIPENTAGDFIGYFVFVAGKFRWDSTIQVVKLLPIESASGIQSLRVMTTPSGDESASGTVYVSDVGHFTLIVPQDWRTNDGPARAQYGIGALTSPDGMVNMLVQQMPTAMSPEGIR